jgi:hypothetical protein
LVSFLAQLSGQQLSSVKIITVLDTNNTSNSSLNDGVYVVGFSIIDDYLDRTQLLTRKLRKKRYQGGSENKPSKSMDRQYNVRKKMINKYLQHVVELVVKLII